MGIIVFFKKIFDIYRIANWYHYLGFIIIGFVLKSSLNSDILIHLFLATFLLAYAFSLNDFYDKKLKKKFFLIPLFSLFFIFIFFNSIQIVISIIFLFIVTMYSTRPFILKAKPFISSICNGVGFSLLFLLGYSYVPVVNLSGILLTLLFFSLEMIAQLIHEMTHIHEDKKDKKITTVVFLGEKKVKKLFYFFFVLSLLFTILLFYLKTIDFIFLISIFLFIIFFILETINKKVDKNFREKYRFLGVIVGILCLLSIFLR